MSDELHGHVASITTNYHGATLVADAATGSTVLYVNDVAQFAVEGGSLRPAKSDGTYAPAVAYTAIDDDAASITLAAPTTIDLFNGSAVRVLDANGNYVVDVEADVIDDANGSVATIDVHHSLIRLLTNSVRAGVDESVVATRDASGAWEVTRVLGKTPVLDAAHARRDRATSLAIATNTDVTLTWDAFPTTRGGMDVTSGVWTIPSDGRYPVTANVQFDGSVSTTGQRRVWFLLNGVWAGPAIRVDAAASGDTHLSVSGVLDCVQGDQITVMVRQNSGVSINVLAGSTATITGLD